MTGAGASGPDRARTRRAPASVSTSSGSTEPADAGGPSPPPPDHSPQSARRSAWSAWKKRSSSGRSGRASSPRTTASARSADASSAMPYPSTRYCAGLSGDVSGVAAKGSRAYCVPSCCAVCVTASTSSARVRLPSLRGPDAVAAPATRTPCGRVLVPVSPAAVRAAPRALPATPAVIGVAADVPPKPEESLSSNASAAGIAPAPNDDTSTGLPVPMIGLRVVRCTAPTRTTHGGPVYGLRYVCSGVTKPFSTPLPAATSATCPRSAAARGCSGAWTEGAPALASDPKEWDTRSIHGCSYTHPCAPALSTTTSRQRLHEP